MATDTRKQDGAAIRRLRRERGIKRIDLAGEVGIHRGFLSGIENEGMPASFETLFRIARVLDVPIETILSEHGRRELKGAA